MDKAVQVEIGNALRFIRGAERSLHRGNVDGALLCLSHARNEAGLASTRLRQYAERSRDVDHRDPATVQQEMHLRGDCSCNDDRTWLDLGCRLAHELGQVRAELDPLTNDD